MRCRGPNGNSSPECLNFRLENFHDDPPKVLWLFADYLWLLCGLRSLDWSAGANQRRIALPAWYWRRSFEGDRLHRGNHRSRLRVFILVCLSSLVFGNKSPLFNLPKQFGAIEKFAMKTPNKSLLVCVQEHDECARELRNSLGSSFGQRRKSEEIGKRQKLFGGNGFAPYGVGRINDKPACQTDDLDRIFISNETEEAEEKKSDFVNLAKRLARVRRRVVPGRIQERLCKKTRRSWQCQLDGVEHRQNESADKP